MDLSILQEFCPDKTDIQVAIEQLKEIMPQLSERPLVLLDRGYVSLWLWCQFSGLAIDVLGRLKCHQTFYQPAPPHSCHFLFISLSIFACHGIFPDIPVFAVSPNVNKIGLSNNYPFGNQCFRRDSIIAEDSCEVYFT